MQRDAAPAPAAVAASEVRRPEPGLARGVWEAPRWTFAAAIAVVVVLAALYAARRTHLASRLLKRRRKDVKP